MTPQAIAMLAVLALGIALHIREVRASRRLVLPSLNPSPPAPATAWEPEPPQTPAAPVIQLADYRKTR